MGLSTWELLIILVIVALLFGTKKLRNIGSDLGGAIKGFRSAIKDEDSTQTKPPVEERVGGDDVIEGEVEPGQKEPDKNSGQ